MGLFKKKDKYLKSLFLILSYHNRFFVDKSIKLWKKIFSCGKLLKKLWITFLYYNYVTTKNWFCCVRKIKKFFNRLDNFMVCGV